MSDATNMGLGIWTMRIILSGLFGVLAYYFITGINLGDMSIHNAFDNHGWDGLFQTVQFSPFSNVSDLAYETRVAIGGAAGVLLLIWRGFWEWMFGLWF